jgi:hypothetical protein
VLVIDDSGDRKDATKTAHVGHQWLGRHGKIDNGVVTVITLWADERLYYSLYAVPTPRPGTSRKGRAIRRSAPSCAQCGRQPDDLAKNLCLASLRDRNEVLFCRLLTDHTEEMLTIIYTPRWVLRSSDSATSLVGRAACTSPLTTHTR